MPWPAEIKIRAGRLEIEPSLRFVVADDARVQRAVERLRRRWQARLGWVFNAASPAKPSRGKPAVVTIEVDRSDAGYPALGADESYTLEVDPRRVWLRAATTWGALRGLATLEQGLRSDARGWFLPTLRIVDRPRFPWRGVLIDVCRHVISMEALERSLEAMALAKFNVLHLHLTNDQGFRVESKRYPRLHAHGSDGDHFTQDQLRGLVAFAAERGIRVVPEFDVPGHTSSWLVGYPELAAAAGPHAIFRTWGVAEAALDPTNEKVYELLEGFFGEMVELFPDAYFHIGGDEVKAKQWSENSRIQRFIQEHGLGDNRGLQAYFNRRINDILIRLDRRMVGWDEILHPELPTATVIQSWRGVEGVNQAAQQGCAALLSNGYYLDLWWPAERHYGFDPLPATTALTAEEQARVLGGEAAMWNEWTTDERLDFALWPRAAAVAERLWSPAAVNEPASLYARLAAFGRTLETLGLRHEANREAMLRRFAGEAASEETCALLRAVAEVFEPVKNYGRNAAQPDVTQFHPLTGFADFLQIDSDAARLFRDEVKALIFGDRRHSRVRAAQLQKKLARWTAAAEALPRRLQASGRVKEVAPAVEALREAVRVARQALQRWPRGDGSVAWRRRELKAVAAACAPRGHFELALEQPLRLLVAAASVRRPRAHSARWRDEVRSAAQLSGPVNAPVYEQWL